MTIYGVAGLAFCFLIGKIIGSWLGGLIGINSDVGGVGFAMIILLFGNAYFSQKGWIQKETKAGVLFWGSMYIPIVVAMASILNVKAAVGGGMVALVVGVTATLGAFLLVPIIAKLGSKTESE